MSFFEGLGRFLQGKPVFEDPHAPSEQTSEVLKTPSADEPSIDKADSRSFPVIRIERVSSHESAGHLQIHGEVKNEWHQEIQLDKIRLLNTQRELDTFLRGEEEREVLLYDGPSPTQPVHEAQLDYKTSKDGDYFQATFDVKFDYDGNSKTYSVDELRLRLPIRDIYG